MVEMYSSGSVVTFDSIANPNGISVYQAGLAQQFGALQQIMTVTGSSSPTVVTTSSAHGYNVGDTVIMQGIAVGTTNNMQLLNNIPFTITAVGSTTQFSIQWNSSGGQYTTLSPSAAYVKKVLYPFLYLPQDNFVVNISQASQAVVITSMYHNLQVGQEVAFRVPSLWGMTQINSLPDNVIPGSPIYGYVVSVTDNWTFVVNINTSNYTAFTNNFTMTSGTGVGLNYPQVVAVGDVNSGGNTYAGGLLYPSPIFPIPNNGVSSINGPAIKGAFVNNTQQGFIIGSGVAQQNTAGTIITANSEILWHAYLHDYASP